VSTITGRSGSSSTTRIMAAIIRFERGPRRLWPAITRLF
jgi:hypothetical protein